MTGTLPPVPLDRLSTDDPRELGGYRLLGRLGAGGMGVAYLAEGPGGWAVVKTMWPQLRTDPSFRGRLARELDAMRACASPSVAAVLDQNLSGDNPWFAMEFVPGVTLKQKVEQGGPLHGQDLRDFAAGLAGALSVTSAAGVVHRDLKPANVMMSPTGPRLIDFGVADIAEATQLTATGFVVGSAGWLAPEQITGGDVSPATDIHAWGQCVLYAATGTPPFQGDNTTATIYQVLHVEPVVPDSLGTLAPLVRAALAKDAAARPTPARITAALSAPGTTTVEAVAPTTVGRLAASHPPPPAAVASGAAPRGRAVIIGVVAAALVLLLVGAGLALGRGSGGSTPAAAPAPATSAAPAQPTPTITVTQTATASAAPLVTSSAAAPAPATSQAAAPAPVPAVIARSQIVSVAQSPSCPNAFGLTGAELLVDGDRNTGWRCDNRASNAEGNVNTAPTAGQSVDFYFGAPQTFTEVQVDEGASGNAFRWCENGRLANVGWNFNDGQNPEGQSFPNRTELPSGNLFVSNPLSAPHTTDHVTMTVTDIYPAGTTCSDNGETGRPWEYGPTAKPSEVRFIGYPA